MTNFPALCDNFRYCETLSKFFFLEYLAHPRTPARIVITPADNFLRVLPPARLRLPSADAPLQFITCADRDLDVERLCNSLKKLIRMYNKWTKT